MTYHELTQEMSASPRFTGHQCSGATPEEREEMAQVVTVQRIPSWFEGVGDLSWVQKGGGRGNLDSGRRCIHKTDRFGHCRTELNAQERTLLTKQNRAQRSTRYRAPHAGHKFQHPGFLPDAAEPTYGIAVRLHIAIQAGEYTDSNRDGESGHKGGQRSTTERKEGWEA